MIGEANSIQRAAVILAAGKGTRMQSEMAKVLHPLGGRPLVSYPIDVARAAGAQRVVVVTGHQQDAVRDAVKAYVGGDAPWLCFAHQAEQKGTGHAVLCALEWIPTECPAVMLLNGDTPLLRPSTLEQLCSMAQASTGKLAMSSIVPEDCRGYGRVVRDAQGQVERIVEHKDATPQELELTECNAGIYCAAGSVLHQFLPGLASNNAQGEIYLTDLVAACRSLGRVGAITMDPQEGAGINTLEQLAQLELGVGRR